VRIWKLLVLVTALAMMVSLSAPLGAGAAKVIELKVAGWQPPMHPVVQQVYIPWGKMIEKATGGRVKFKWFWGGTLVKAEQGLTGVRSGLADIAMPLAVWAFGSQFPVTTALFMPFQLKNELNATQAFYECYRQIPELRNEYKGMKVIGFMTSGVSNFHMRSILIKKIADLKNQRIWGGNALGVASLKIWGASPRITKLADIYMSLQRGAITGVIFPTPPLHSFRFTDLVNKHTICDFVPAAQIAVMNLKRWNSLPPDIQKVFMKYRLPLTVAVGVKNLEMNKYILAQLKKRGDQIYIMPQAQRARWRATLQPVYARQIELMNKAGLKGAAIMKKIQAIVAQTAAHPLKRAPYWKALGQK
jgi:TRAP-type C4-dicarboxylate transport system substrate-binding protein